MVFFSFLFSTNCCILILLVSYIFIYKWMKRLLYDHTLTLLIHDVQVGGWRGGVDWWAWYNSTDLHGTLDSRFLALPPSPAGHLCQTLIYEYSYYFSYYLSIISFFVRYSFSLFLFFLSLISNLLCYTPATIDCFFFHCTR